jgi:hypothetical protein
MLPAANAFGTKQSAQTTGQASKVKVRTPATWVPR